MDGAIARKTQKDSSFGAFFDSLTDRFSDAMPFMAIALSSQDKLLTFLSIMAIISSFGVNYARARAEGLGYELKVGAFERTERWIVLLVGILLEEIYLALITLIVGSSITIAQRIYIFMKIEVRRVLAIDLSPGERRLGVGVIMDNEFVSKPIFFQTELIKKIGRIYKEIGDLERKIDNIYNAIGKSNKKEERERLKGRLAHLFGKQKRRWFKIKNLRKQILESFVNLVIAHAKAYHCQAIAVEKLQFKNHPEWKNKRALTRFTQWFYSKFSNRLEEKAKVYGLKVLEVNPYNTSKVCARCGDVGKLEGLVLRCSCGSYDRDYNASLNIGKRALHQAKSRTYMVRDIPGRIPSRLERVEGSALEMAKLG